MGAACLMVSNDISQKLMAVIKALYVHRESNFSKLEGEIRLILSADETWMGRNH